MQNCPSSFGFACPQPWSWGGGESYGEREGGDVTCSYLGAVYFLSAGVRGGVRWWSSGVLGGWVLWYLLGGL